MSEGIEVGKVSLGMHLNSKPIQQQMGAMEGKLGSTCAGIGAKMGKAMSAAVASSSMRKVQAEIDKVTSHIGGLKETIEAYSNQLNKVTATAQRGDIWGKTAAASAEKIKEEIRGVTAELGQYETVLERLNGQKQAIFTGLQERQEAEAVRQLGDETGRSADQFSRLRASADRVNYSLKNGFMTTIKYGLGIRSLYALFNRLRTYVSEGITAFAAYDAQTSTTINSLKASLNGLKGSLAAAFAPIVNTIGPILTQFVDWLSEAISAVTMFISVLSGKDYYYKAQKGASSTAAAITGIGSAAKEAMRYLASFDQMNVLPDNSSSGGGGGGGASGSGNGLSFTKEAIGESGPLSLSLSDITEKVEQLSAKLGEIAGTAVRIAVEWGKDTWSKLKQEWNRRMLEYNGNSITVAISFAVDILSWPGKILTWIEQHIKSPFQKAMAEALGIDPDSTGWRIFTGISDALTQANLLLTPVIGKIFSALKLSQLIGNLFKNIDIQELGNKIRDGFITVWNTFVDLLKTNGKIVSLANLINFDLDNLKIDPIEIEAKAGITGMKDKIPAKNRLLDKFTTKLTSWKEGFFGVQKKKEISTTAKLANLSDGMTAKEKTVSATARLAKVFDGLTAAQKTIVTTSKFGAVLDVLTTAQKTLAAKAKFSEWENGGISPWSYAKAWFNEWANSGISPWSYAKAWYNDWDNYYTKKPWAYADAYFDEYYTKAAGGGWYNMTKALGGVFSGGSWQPIQAYASGGAPGGGQLFVAREAGPELVGTLGGHTAVMNNDQIVASVSAGVARAVAGIKFYSRDAATPHLAIIGASVTQSEKHLSQLAQQAASAAAGGGVPQVITLLGEILAALQSLDLDVQMDGVSVKDRIVQLINQHTRATGVCEILT